jgi:mediator of RNA polymerase II transcription subunit 16, fungi type
MDSTDHLTLPVSFVCRLKFLTDAVFDRKIAWSRLGGIAYISPDGFEVWFRCLRFQSLIAKWELSKDYPIVQRSVTDEPRSFVHLEWSQTGMDLAVTDTVGRISIFTFSSTAVNQFIVASIVHPDQQNELDRAVGVYWLHPERQVGC